MKAATLRNTSMIGLCILASNNASADGLSASTFIGFGETPYKNTSSDNTPLPFIQYDSDNWYIKGTNIGAYLTKSREHQLSIFAGYSPFKFDPQDSNDIQMRRLDDRYTTGILGVDYTHYSRSGIVSAKLTHDFLDVYNGLNADLSYGLMFPLNNIRIMPKAGITWSSSDFNDYYFGISSAEANRSGLDAYDADASITPYLSVTTIVTLSERVSLMLNADARFLPSEVTDSPMVDKDTIYGGSVGLSYTF